MTNPFLVPAEGGRLVRPVVALVAMGAAVAVGASIAAVGTAINTPAQDAVPEAAREAPTARVEAAERVETTASVPRMVVLQPALPSVVLTEPAAPETPPQGSPQAPAEAVPQAEPRAAAPVPPSSGAPSPAPIVHARDARLPGVQGSGAQAYSGVWAPRGEACIPRLNRRGLLPALITSEGAYAGETSCAFSNGRQVGPNRWTFAASCSGPRGKWRTTVRISAEGDRLTWSSKRGSQAYVRCGTSGMMRAGVSARSVRAG